MNYRQKKFDADPPTHLRTDMSAYRVALQFYWTRLKMHERDGIEKTKRKTLHTCVSPVQAC